jgi:hypothetical protein
LEHDSWPEDDEMLESQYERTETGRNKLASAQPFPNISAAAETHPMFYARSRD